MGTKVHCKSYLPGYFSMRDPNEASGSSNWPLFYGDKTLPDGIYYNSFLPRTVTNAYPTGDKDALKQTMIEHEATFKHQVFELHRLYNIQRDMMGEMTRKELHKHLLPMETSSSSSPLVSQILPEDAWKWHKLNFPFANSVSARPSVSGAENISSPPSCTKGNSTLAGRIPSQSECSSKDCEILEFRPSKVRKKLFDLELPADEYIDTEREMSPDNKISDISTFCHSIYDKATSESSVKLKFGSVAKIDCDGDASRIFSLSGNSVGFADLNEPILVEDAPVPASADFMGRAEVKDIDLADKPKPQFLLGLPKENLQNSRKGSNYGNSINLDVENKRIGREWSSYMYEGHCKTHVNYFPQGLQPDKLLVSPQLTHATQNKVHQPMGSLPSDYSRGDLWRERTAHGLEHSERSCDRSCSKHLEPFVASRVPNPFPLVHASDLDNSWSHSISTLAKPNGSSTQKVTSIQTHPPLDSLGTFSRNSQACAQSHEIFIEKRPVNSSSGSNPSYGSGLPYYNSFSHGSSSGSKDVQTHVLSSSFDYLNCNKEDKVASELSINYGSVSYLKGSNVGAMKLAKDMNLNACSSIDEDRNCQGHLEVFPWIKAKPADKNGGTSTRRDFKSSELSFLRVGSSDRSEIVKDPNQLFTRKITLPTHDREVGGKRNEIIDCRVNGRILGSPIVDNPCTPKNDSSSVVSTSASLRCPHQFEDMKNRDKGRGIDINQACDLEPGAEIAAEVLVLDKGRGEKVADFRTHIDLNLCASEDEVALAPSFASSTSVNMKIAVDINLEVPAVPETEEDTLPLEDQKQNEMSSISPQPEVKQPHDDAVRFAAGAIVSISSSGHFYHMEDTATCHPLEAPLEDSLLWFVEVIASYVDDLDSKFGTKSGGKDQGDNDDYFEVMTLNLTEINEEEYMPKPLVPEIWNVEENGSISSPSRQRKGQARRGRQRRDFQRDILPGLASLSRHEVSEDLQIFGGLMKATGHSWHLGLTRRNGGAARGRRRSLVDPAPAVPEVTVCTPLVQQLSSFEIGLVDSSLTGWGKTPRRPRRQRCPVGNPTSIALA